MVLILFVQVLKKVLKSLKFDLKYPGGTLWDYFHMFYTVCFQNKTAVLPFSVCGSLLKLIVKPLLPVI